MGLSEANRMPKWLLRLFSRVEAQKQSYATQQAAFSRVLEKRQLDIENQLKELKNGTFGTTQGPASRRFQSPLEQLDPFADDVFNFNAPKKVLKSIKDFKPVRGLDSVQARVREWRDAKIQPPANRDPTVLPDEHPITRMIRLTYPPNEREQRISELREKLRDRDSREHEAYARVIEKESNFAAIPARIEELLAKQRSALDEEMQVQGEIAAETYARRFSRLVDEADRIDFGEPYFEVRSVLDKEVPLAAAEDKEVVRADGEEANKEAEAKMNKEAQNATSEVEKLGVRREVFVNPKYKSPRRSFVEFTIAQGERWKAAGKETDKYLEQLVQSVDFGDLVMDLVDRDQAEREKFERIEHGKARQEYEAAKREFWGIGLARTEGLTDEERRAQEVEQERLEMEELEREEERQRQLEQQSPLYASLVQHQANVVSAWAMKRAELSERLFAVILHHKTRVEEPDVDPATKLNDTWIKRRILASKDVLQEKKNKKKAYEDAMMAEFEIEKGKKAREDLDRLREQLKKGVDAKPPELEREGGEGKEESMTPSNEMSLSEAIRVLGLAKKPTPEELLEKRDTMVTLNDPELGGSPYLKSKVAIAADVVFQAIKSNAAFPASSDGVASAEEAKTEPKEEKKKD